MPSLPTGTVTFLLTDIEGSTALWDAHPGEMSQALADHDRIVAGAVAARSGHVVKSRGEGDSVFAVFERATDAIKAGADIMTALADHEWPAGMDLRVRIGINTGEAEQRDGDFFGPAVNRGARLRALAKGGQVLVSAASQQLAAHLDGELALRDLGEHRLRGFATAERIFQLTGPGLTAEFAPLATEAQLGNLPASLTSFVGRERELDELAAVLAQSRLLVVTGVGGTGKTRTAVELATRNRGRYPGGAWLVELAQLADPALVLSAIAAALGLKERADMEPFEVVATRLRQAPTLLVLDNCEHLVEAAAHFSGALLRDCPDLTVIATSREALGIPGERVSHLPPLDGDEASVLFIERARTLGTTIDSSGYPAVSAICRSVEGIPLAVELAASRIRVMTLDQIAERLADRFKLLSSSGRGVSARHQTLRATIDWSHRLLGPEEAALFEQLAVFAGGFTLEAVEAVCLGEDQLEGLAGLADKSLIRKDPAQARYTMLETIRDYAGEKLAARSDSRDIGERHVRYFFDLCSRFARQDPARLTPDLDNVRAALRWCRASDLALGLGLANGLAPYWPNLGFITEGSAWLAEFLAAAPADSSDTALGLYEMGWFAIWQQDRDTATAHFTSAAAMARDLGQDDLAGRAINGTAFVALQEGRVAETTRIVTAALPALRAAANPVPLAQGLYYLAFAGVGVNPPDANLEILQESRHYFELAGLPADVGMADISIGIEYVLAGRLADAEAALRRSLAGRRQLRDLSNVPALLSAVAALALKVGLPEQAVQLHSLDRQLQRQLGIVFPESLESLVWQPIWKAAGQPPVPTPDTQVNVDLPAAFDLMTEVLDRVQLMQTERAQNG